jgi:homoserine O-succinyltransferase
MPVLANGAAGNGAMPAAQWAGNARDTSREMNPDCIFVGLLNNMPDSALQSTERQFIELLDAASADIPVHLRLFSLPHMQRSQSARNHMSNDYCSLAELWSSRIDGLIVTGTEPRAPCLKDEPYWASLTDVLEWAQENTASTIWSCLAAHAAVLHMDGIARHLLSDKRFGLFECTGVSSHPLIAGVPTRMQIAHSRWNELREEELRASNYTILMRSRQAGVDTFIKEQRKSLFVFFQGHPEYDPRALLREYRRDIGRFLHGERGDYPSMPQGYFDALAADPLAGFQARAVRERHEALLDSLPLSLLEPLIAPVARTPVVRIYANWLAYVRARKRQLLRLNSEQSALHRHEVHATQPAQGIG